ncbi:MAG: agglutinin biogenesis protein MshI [Sulfuritalea sp.]|nr:agglutinin biogenesis protein MshI [Sulfuritalea sp.]
MMRGDRVDLVHLRREAGRKPRVLLADSVENGADAAATLSALKKPMRLDCYRCTALLTHGKYQLIQTDAVAGAPDEAREVVRWKLKDQVEFPVDTAAIDLLPIPSDGRTPQVFAALSPESTIAPLVQAFQAAKVALQAIDLPEVSQRNLAALFEKDGRALATLVFDDDEGLLTFTLNSELLVVRHVELNARQLMTADDDRRNMLFERIALDVQRSLDNFDRLYSAVPLTHLLVAPIPGVDGFLDYLRTNLTISVVPMDVSSVLDLGAVPALLDPLRQFQCLRAIGAALRGEPEAA